MPRPSLLPPPPLSRSLSTPFRLVPDKLSVIFALLCVPTRHFCCFDVRQLLLSPHISAKQLLSSKWLAKNANDASKSARFLTPSPNASQLIELTKLTKEQQTTLSKYVSTSEIHALCHHRTCLVMCFDAPLHLDRFSDLTDRVLDHWHLMDSEKIWYWIGTNRQRWLPLVRKLRWSWPCMMIISRPLITWKLYYTRILHGSHPHNCSKHSSTSTETDFRD